MARHHFDYWSLQLQLKLFHGKIELVCRNIYISVLIASIFLFPSSSPFEIIVSASCGNRFS